jgi:hypothetical protein
MNALSDAADQLADALSRAEILADALHDRPERADALHRFDELRVAVRRNLAMVAAEIPTAIAAAEASDNAAETPEADPLVIGPPARGSSPQILAHGRARRDTLADSPRALRDIGAPRIRALRWYNSARDKLRALGPGRLPGLLQNTACEVSTGTLRRLRPPGRPCPGPLACQPDTALAAQVEPLDIFIQRRSRSVGRGRRSVGGR